MGGLVFPWGSLILGPCFAPSLSESDFVFDRALVELEATEPVSGGLGFPLGGVIGD